jgi:hypothetical protein
MKKKYELKNEQKNEKKNEGRRVECLKPARQNEAGRVDAVSICIYEYIVYVCMNIYVYS